MHTYIHVYMHTWIHAYVHTYIHTHIYIYIYIHIYIYIYSYIEIHIYIYIHTYIYTYIHIYIYIDECYYDSVFFNQGFINQLPRSCDSLKQCLNRQASRLRKARKRAGRDHRSLKPFLWRYGVCRDGVFAFAGTRPFLSKPLLLVLWDDLVCAAENKDGCVRLWITFTVLALLAVLLEEGPAPITLVAELRLATGASRAFRCQLPRTVMAPPPELALS